MKASLEYVQMKTTLFTYRLTSKAHVRSLAWISNRLINLLADPYLTHLQRCNDVLSNGAQARPDDDPKPLSQAMLRVKRRAGFIDRSHRSYARPVCLPSQPCETPLEAAPCRNKRPHACCIFLKITTARRKSGPSVKISVGTGTWAGAI